MTGNKTITMEFAAPRAETAQPLPLRSRSVQPRVRHAPTTLTTTLLIIRLTSPLRTSSSSFSADSSSVRTRRSRRACAEHRVQQTGGRPRGSVERSWIIPKVRHRIMPWRDYCICPSPCAVYRHQHSPTSFSNCRDRSLAGSTTHDLPTCGSISLSTGTAAITCTAAGG